MIPEDLLCCLSFLDAAGSNLKPHVVYMSETESYQRVQGYDDGRVFPGMSVPICSMVVDTSWDKKTAEFFIKWRLKCEDGIIPPSGLFQMDFRREVDHTFGTRYQDTAPAKPQYTSSFVSS
jgi:hypothetical protein